MRSCDRRESRFSGFLRRGPSGASDSDAKAAQVNIETEFALSIGNADAAWTSIRFVSTSAFRPHPPVPLPNGQFAEVGEMLLRAPFGKSDVPRFSIWIHQYSTSAFYKSIQHGHCEFRS